MEAHKSPKIDAPADKPRDERSEVERASRSSEAERAPEGSPDPRSDQPKSDQPKSDPKKEESKPGSAGTKEKSLARARIKSKNNVRKLRMERMMSKAELARRASVSTLTVDRVERGMPCRMDTKRKILEALGLKPSDRVMVFGEDD